MLVDYSSFQNLCITQKCQALSVMITISSDFITSKQYGTQKEAMLCTNWPTNCIRAHKTLRFVLPSNAENHCTLVSKHTLAPRNSTWVSDCFSL